MSFEFLRRNLALKIFSVVLAIVLWSYVKYVQMPQAIQATRSKIRVPLTVEGKTDKLIMMDNPDDIEITVKGSTQAIAGIDPHHFKAYLDLKDKKAGQHQLPVKVTTPPGVEIVKIEPEKVVIKLDSAEKRLFTVKVRPQGAIAKGFIMGTLSSKPESVTVNGAQSLFSKLKEVQAVCDVEGADMDRIQQSEVEAVDENGQLIKDLTVEPLYVRVSVNVKSEVTNSIVPIIPNLEGTPAKGYKIESVTVVPKVASIRYRYDMEIPPALIKTRSVNLDKLSKKNEFETGLLVPDGIILVSEEKVKVIVNLTRDTETSGASRGQSGKKIITPIKPAQ